MLDYVAAATLDDDPLLLEDRATPQVVAIARPRLVGYARVSTDVEQTQLDLFRVSGEERDFDPFPST